MKIKFKKSHPDAQTPTKADSCSAGWDIYAASEVSYTKEYIEYKTGLHVEIPKGHVGLIYPRSSISNFELGLCNSVGVIDHGYSGEILLRFRITRPWNYLDTNGFYSKEEIKLYNKGDRIGQLIVMPYPELEWEEVDELSESDRGNGGFGSSGR